MNPALGLASDRFHLVRELGRGGSGTVYEALDTRDDSTVALKLLRSLEQADRARFSSAFDTMSRVRHPNLVRLHEYHCTEAHCFYTMELVRGTDFRRWVRQPGPAPPGGHEVLTVTDVDISALPTSPEQRGPLFHEGCLRDALTQLLSAVVAIHRAGRVHCDLKPANVMVDPDGRLVVLDFGLVVDTSRPGPSALEREVFGTAVYMSPEMTREQPGPAADAYAVGVMLFEALTGRRPFAGAAREVLVQKAFDAAPDPRAVVGGLPDDLATMTTQLLNRNPDERPDAATLLDLLTGSQPDR